MEGRKFKANLDNNKGTVSEKKKKTSEMIAAL